MSVRLVAASLVVGALLFPARAIALDRHVPSDYPTIQAAIDASAPGDRVVVAPGTYTGPGNVNLGIAVPNLTVTSEYGPAEGCVVDCEFNSAAFTLSNGATVQGMTFTHTRLSGAFAARVNPGCRLEYCRFVDNGLGLLIYGDCVISDCTFQRNGSFGAQVEGDTGTTEFWHCTFDSNVTGGLAQMDVFAVSLFVYGSTFSNQSYAFSGANTDLVNCAFSNNGIGVNPSTAVGIYDCSFTANTVGIEVPGWIEAHGDFQGNGIGVQLEPYAGAWVSGTFQGNGVGIHIGRQASAWLGGKFEGNNTSIEMEDLGYLDLSGSQLVRNGAGIVGGDNNWVRIWSTYFLGNAGWAVDLGRWPDAVAVNAVICGNGGGMRCIGDATEDGVEQLFACLSTIVENRAGAVVDPEPDPVNWTFAKDSIVWNNGPQDFYGAIGIDSDVSTGAGDGWNNISQPPLFVRAPSPGPDGVWGTLDDDYGDLRLRPGSPCINRAGYFLDPYEVADYDIVGTPRIVGAMADQGAYEFPFELQLISLSKTSAFVGGAPITVTATGVFPPGSILTWNGQPVPTTRVGTTGLRMVVTAEQLATAGVFQLAVFARDYLDNPAGGWSNPLPFTVMNRVPTIASLDPASVVHGGSGFTLNVIGDRFVPASVVYWNGVARATTNRSPTSLSVDVSAEDIAAVGRPEITVVNPAPGGGTSNVKRLVIR